jgi:hypothetical protein
VPLFSVDEFAAYMQSTVDAATANLLHDLALGALQAELGQVLTVVDGDMLEDTPIGQVLVLPEMPVTAVTEVVDLATDDVITGWALSSSGVLTLPYLYSRVRVTYSHGYAAFPLAFKKVALQAASRAYSNPTGEKSETVGAVATSHPEVELSDAERRILDAYRP